MTFGKEAIGIEYACSECYKHERIHCYLTAIFSLSNIEDQSRKLILRQS
jgi:hypothetical protein